MFKPDSYKPASFSPTSFRGLAEPAASSSGEVSVGIAVLPMRQTASQPWYKRPAVIACMAMMVR